MGYGIYQEWSNGRWAGYMVPAECDWPDCRTRIDRGLAYKCEEHFWYDDEDSEHEEAGCGLFFCDEHRYLDRRHQHDDIRPKPDSAEWIRWMLMDGSWSQWRNENPDEVRAVQQQLAAGVR